MNKQQGEMNALRKRIDAGENEQRKQRALELERLLQRYQNVKKVGARDRDESEMQITILLRIGVGESAETGEKQIRKSGQEGTASEEHDELDYECSRLANEANRHTRAQAIKTLKTYLLIEKRVRFFSSQMEKHLGFWGFGGTERVIRQHHDTYTLLWIQSPRQL